MISSNAFDKVNLLDRAADYSWKRETIIANNIANADTPTYKRKDLDFSAVLLNEMTKLGEDIGQENAGVLADKLNTDSLVAEIYTDYKDFSYRIDENNVDPDTENVEMASEQLKYQMLTTSIRGEFTRLKTAIGS